MYIHVVYIQMIPLLATMVDLVGQVGQVSKCDVLAMCKSHGENRSENDQRMVETLW